MKLIGAERATIRNSLLTASCHFLRLLAMRNDLRSADGGDRTHTRLRELDFESSASANSTTSAFVRRQLVVFLPRNARKSGVQAPEQFLLKSSRFPMGCS